MKKEENNGENKYREIECNLRYYDDVTINNHEDVITQLSDLVNSLPDAHRINIHLYITSTSSIITGSHEDAIKEIRDFVNSLPPNKGMIINATLRGETLIYSDDEPSHISHQIHYDAAPQAPPIQDDRSEKNDISQSDRTVSFPLSDTMEQSRKQDTEHQKCALNHQYT
jgi:hypothetical protein